MSYTNWAVQLQNMARDLKFLIYYYFTIPMAHFSCMVNPQLICAFLFTYAKSRFSLSFFRCGGSGVVGKLLILQL